MHIRPHTQRRVHQEFIESLNVPIQSKKSSLQGYLLRNVCTHALTLQQSNIIRTMVQRFDFLDQYEAQHGLAQISYFWSIIDPNEKGDSYQKVFQYIWAETPSKTNTRFATILIELFGQMRWHEHQGRHFQRGIQWLEPHQNAFHQTYIRFKQGYAFYKISYGNMNDGLREFQTQLTDRNSTANTIFHRFTETLKQPSSKEKTALCKSLLEELRTLPPSTINRFRYEQILIPFSFDTIEEKEQALLELATIIPFQHHDADDLETQINKMHFDMYLKAKRHAEAVNYGYKVLNASRDISLSTRRLLQLQIDRCTLYLRSVQESIDNFSVQEANIQQHDDPKLLEEWQQYVLALALLSVKYYGHSDNVTEQCIWQQRLVGARKFHFMQHQHLSHQFTIPLRHNFSQRLALDLYQLGVLYDKIKATSEAIEAFQESSDLFESIQSPKRPIYAKQWANVLWKVHYRTDTENNRTGLLKCLQLRNRLQQSGVKGLNYALVTVRNTLGTWALRREDWNIAKEHHTVCLTLINALVQTYPEKKVYHLAQHKIRVRLSWSLYHLQEHASSFEIASAIDSSNVLTKDTLFAYLEKSMADL